MIAIGLASFLAVFAKSFQQLSVNYKKYWWVPPMSYVMAGLQVYITIAIVTDPSISTAIVLGTGAFLGSWASMWLHPRITGKGWGKRERY